MPYHSRLITALILSVTLTAAQSVSAADVDFSLPGLDQPVVRLADYRGRWVVVNFWATWCTPCLDEIPELAYFHDTYREQDAVVVSVDYEDIDAATLREFATAQGINYPVALSDGQPLAGFTLKGLPTTFLVSPEGRIVNVHLGAVTAAMLERRINAFKQAGSP